MRTWLRELLGVGLVLFGLFVWSMCMLLLLSTQLIEGSVFFFIGMISFKAGIHLIRVGMAARILLGEGKTADKDLAVR